MGIVKTEILNIGDFLLNKNLSIPKFQRPYKWTAKNVVQLINDIERFKGDTPYRIGTIVIHQGKDKAEIVDGQQRCITFLLMLKSIMAEKFYHMKCPNLQSRLQQIQSQAFTPIFRNDLSRKNIKENYVEIVRRIANVDEAFIDFFLNKCEITHFVIDDISEAFQFFDAQNARGRDLEPHDLLKAFHLRELNNSINHESEASVAALVDTWEEMDTQQLANLFADFLYRVRGWSKGYSSRYFTKNDIPLFKGINLEKAEGLPFVKIYEIADRYTNTGSNNGVPATFPFQLDQTIINGKYFFEMITHYHKVFQEIKMLFPSLTPEAQNILATLDRYKGRERTGDKYVRMLFNCALIYYVDKFGQAALSKAIEKIFAWAYTIRLEYQNLQLASVDNYVIQTSNLFKHIREVIYKEDVLEYQVPLISEEYRSDKTEEIRDLFQKMKYYAHE